MILLTAEMLRAEGKSQPQGQRPGHRGAAWIRDRGAVATVLVQKGTLHVGDPIGRRKLAHGKVRAMMDDNGRRRVKEAGPSMPVEILGFSDVPNAGEIFVAHEIRRRRRETFAETFISRRQKNRLLEETKAKMSLDDLFSQIQAGNVKELNIIVKADVQGSVEAVKQSSAEAFQRGSGCQDYPCGVGAINEIRCDPGFRFQCHYHRIQRASGCCRLRPRRTGRAWMCVCTR